MTPLIDGDMLLYECCFSLEYQRKNDTEWTFPEFDDVHTAATNKITEICNVVEAVEPPCLVFTDTKWLAEQEGREYIPVFRYGLAKTKPYKAGRKKEKPFYYNSLMVTLLAEYFSCVAEGGKEADDLLGILQCANDENPTIICSRDKDLRQIPGWHFSWETKINPSFGPAKASGIGRLWKTKKGKVFGLGWKWFFYQMLVGDSVDNIAGCKGVGPVAAYAELEDCTSLRQMYDIVYTLYNKVYKKEAYYIFHEMADLLYIMQDDMSFQEKWKQVNEV